MKDTEYTPMAKFIILLCLLVISMMLFISVIGMSNTLDRLHSLSATDCEAAAEFCEDQT